MNNEEFNEALKRHGIQPMDEQPLTWRDYFYWVCALIVAFGGFCFLMSVGGAW